MPLTEDEVKMAKKFRQIGMKDLLNLADKITQEKTDFISNYNIFDMCSWLVWKDLWLKDKKGSPKVRDRYDRRKLVLVELGAANIESEASYEHPAVIIHNSNDWVLIAPITSKRYGKGIDFLIDIPKGTCSLTENSSVQLDHIRCISKKRITGTLAGSLPVEYMNKVNMVILEKYIHPIYQEFIALKDLNEFLDENNKALKEENNVFKELLKRYENGENINEKSS